MGDLLNIIRCKQIGGASGGRVFLHHVIARELSCDEDGVVGDASFYIFCQKAGLDFQHSSVGKSVVEERVGDEGVHAGFVGLIKGFATVWFECDGFAR